MTKGSRETSERKGAAVNIYPTEGDSKRERRTGEKVLGKGKQGLPGWVVDRRPTRQLLVINRVTSNTLKLRRISFCFRRRNNLPSPSIYSEFKDTW